MRANRGSTTSPRMVSRQSSATMKESVAATVTRLVTMSTSVELTAVCAPRTSLFMRLMSSPVRLFVKNRRDMRCRWA